VINAELQSYTNPVKRFLPSRQERYGPSATKADVGWQNACPAIQIVESETEYGIVVPLSGIDARNVYIFAAPHSVMIEVRLKRSVRHGLMDDTVTETIDQRIERAFGLPAEIERGGTTVRISGESLFITARKAVQSRNTLWSQLIQFDAKLAAAYA
jgi:HSP20 family molecular chaperone IbpA